MALEPQIGEFEETKQSCKTEKEIRQWLEDHKIGRSTALYILGYLLGRIGISWISIDAYDDSLSEVDYHDFVFWFEGNEDEERDKGIQVELQIDSELRDDLAGLARYDSAEIEQSDCELRERIICSYNASRWEYDSEDDFFMLVDRTFKYIKTGKHE